MNDFLQGYIVGTVASNPPENLTGAIITLVLLLLILIVVLLPALIDWRKAVNRKKRWARIYEELLEMRKGDNR